MRKKERVRESDDRPFKNVIKFKIDTFQEVLIKLIKRPIKNKKTAGLPRRFLRQNRSKNA